MFCLSGVLVSLLAHLFPRKPKDVITKQQWAGRARKQRAKQDIGNWVHKEKV
ncbi:uncharacterized protein Dsimw501_GD27469 [Drosophila simulans]|uniref:Uncharacterized protein n=1 Tax=Drosophila simulans TaxID=7240 RepID=A0A0J9TQ87_DROSI|nr:uncharacterized protein Dsimw501_GD27469 [Drosophila simulans]